MEVLNEVLSETHQRVLDTSHRLTELTMELENENAKVAEMHAEFNIDTEQFLNGIDCLEQYTKLAIAE